MDRMKSLQSRYVKTDSMPSEQDVVLSDGRRRESPYKEIEARAVTPPPSPTPAVTVSPPITTTPTPTTASTSSRPLRVSTPSGEEVSIAKNIPAAAIKMNIPAPVAAAAAVVAVKPVTPITAVLSQVEVGVGGDMVQEVMSLPVKGGFQMPVGLTDAAHSIGYQRAVDLFRESCGISAPASDSDSAVSGGGSVVASKVSRSQGEGALRAGILKELLNHPEYGTAHVVSEKHHNTYTV